MENDTAAAAAAANNNTATAKVGSGGVKSNNHNLEEEHSNLNGEEHMAEQVEAEEEEDREADVGEGEPTGSALNPRQPTRTPFTNLSQVDADLALARTLQEQERAYMMLRMNNEGSDYGSWEGESYLHDDGDDFDDLHDGTDVDVDVDVDEDDEDDDDDDDDDEDDDNEEYEDEDAFDVHASAGEHDNPSIEFDPDVFSSDEAYARALQEAEEREMAARLLALAGINDREAEDVEEHGANSQDAWEDVDPDELSYEELLALGEVVGTESRGLSTDTIAGLPSLNYKVGSDQHGSNDSCVICRVDFEDGDSLTHLSCKHLYHPECINNWLKINKVCPVCSTEVSASGSNL
ncbi:E3 ubiquitin ligase BIG BROTHER-related-like [Vigna unguiculata]|uniref:E3 ubiquitin ligase BIG BROTHER-related-like n=1 Tax=Vigna unguiculata TaxID=3917 RepID=UPI00101696F3|nr:E3 ubiquitin ligase BIG BROTHER-related-like [Vigna unguiculata]